MPNRYPVKENEKTLQYVSVTELDESKPPLSWPPRLMGEYIYSHLGVILRSPWKLPEIIEKAKWYYSEYSKQAMAVGSDVHSMIERFLLGKPCATIPHEFEESLPAFTAFVEWYKQNDVVPLIVEEKVYNHKHRWAGTCDFWGLLNGKLYVIDWKSSMYEHPWHRVQTAAYRSMMPEGTVGNAILHVDKKSGEYKFKDYSKTYKRDLRTFNYTVLRFYNMHPLIAKKAGR